MMESDGIVITSEPDRTLYSVPPETAAHAMLTDAPVPAMIALSVVGMVLIVFVPAIVLLAVYGQPL
jgi:hypothetical protein